MNARLKLFFLANLSRQKIGSDRGFALPIALMVGMVILVVGATMIIRAQGDQSKIIAQATSNKAMAIAEAGATRYVDFLNNNRGLIPYSACVTQDATTGACSDTSSVKSWYGAGLTTTGSSTSIPNIKPSPSTASPSPSASPSCSTSGSSASLPSNYQQASASTISTWSNSTVSGNNSGWKDSADGSGQYRLVGYRTYKDASASNAMNPDADAPTSAVTARLIVEGRVNQSGSGASATDGSNGGKARVEITIPVTATTNGASPSPSTISGFPGLWAKDFNYGNNTTAYSNVWDSSGCGTGTDGFNSTIDKIPLPDASNRPTLGSGVDASPGANNGNKEIYAKSGTTGVKTMVNEAFPALPNSTTTTPSWPAATFSTTSANVNACNWSPSQYPRTNDKDTTGKVYGNTTSTTADDPAANATYVYNCGDLGGVDNTLTLGRTGQETLIFHVNGYMKTNSNGSIIPYNGGTNGFTRAIFYVKTGFEVNANGNLGDMRDPSGIQVYDYQVDAGTYGESGYEHTLEMKGNGSFYGFLFAPFANMEANGTTDIAGALWIKGTQANGNPKVWQGIFGWNRLMVTPPSSSSYTTYNLDGSPTAWKRVQAN